MDVGPEQGSFLARLMSREDPANLAIVAACLAPAARTGFLDALAPQAAAGVLAHVSTARFADPDAAAIIREQLKKRLAAPAAEAVRPGTEAAPRI
jgi:flagellar motor switch protein FliG